MNHYAQDKHQPPEPRRRRTGTIQVFDTRTNHVPGVIQIPAIEIRPTDPADLDELIAAAREVLLIIDGVMDILEMERALDGMDDNAIERLRAALQPREAKQ